MIGASVVKESFKINESNEGVDYIALAHLLQTVQGQCSYLIETS